ncbi:hypothetical protein PV08_06989 [Exophiala spinifera]|uniref:Uncharacterized protein n=1 Tax=Exophiala spinifera TaxID=91928 RepID=A0A0D2B5K2_9EURO|nr:uncharacterized protein PV08_06989 [Exophiala spinifera]KIW14208.1 hypothetical protein PV08_06989 [Exophiala spinifera]
MVTCSARASRALTFMRQCRSSTQGPAPAPGRQSPVARTSSRQSSQFAPSNFTHAPSSPKPFEVESSSFRTQSSPAALATPRPSYAHPRARRFTATETSTKLTAWTWFKTLFGWRPKPNYKPAPFHITNNPYRARKRWPPDFNNLDPKQQFHFEKTYRRRAALKWARPTWNKSIKILQQTLITSTIIYFVFILEPTHGHGTPFDGFRVWFFEKIGTLGQLPESTKVEAAKLKEEAERKLNERAKVDVDNNSPTTTS